MTSKLVNLARCFIHRFLYLVWYGMPCSCEVSAVSVVCICSLVSIATHSVCHRAHASHCRHSTGFGSVGQWSGSTRSVWSLPSLPSIDREGYEQWCCPRSWCQCERIAIAIECKQFWSLRQQWLQSWHWLWSQTLPEMKHLCSGGWRDHRSDTRVGPDRTRPEQAPTGTPGLHSYRYIC